MPNTLWKFIDNNGTFIASDPHKISRLYFPLCNNKGLMSSITPNLGGDIKKDLNSFLLIPTTTEGLKESRYNRNFWVLVNDRHLWSAASGKTDSTSVEGGLLYHKLTRINNKIGLKAEFLNFVPTEDFVELELITITNISKKHLRIIPTIAIPIFARSLDRLHDHRHVSSLLNRIKINKFGVIVTPTMSFEERGHKINDTSYFILGCSSLGKPPKDIFPTILNFTGEDGNLDNPRSISKENLYAKNSLDLIQGKEAIGALRFKKLSLPPGKSASFIALMGIAEKSTNIQSLFKKYGSKKKILYSLQKNKSYWLDMIGSIKFSTKNPCFDSWIKWVTLQPILRKIYGCSFLPDFDYGRGGRGWRDLWQDCLTLILISPKHARKILINNFAGVRLDGSNATIIGKRPGEFISDRNNIQRIWMDHGLWPFITLNLYINQTGDTDILFEKTPYFESSHKDTLLDHILLQHKRLFSRMGKHGNFLLEGGDWNDGLDMAKEHGESVAFTAAYINNLIELSNLLEKLNYNKKTIEWLRNKAKLLEKNILKNELITLKTGSRFFNGYYDNLGRQVEGNKKSGLRMTLTGQVFPIMSGVPSPQQVKEIYKSTKRYLWDNKIKGFRLNTDFKGTYHELGRAFSFIYGEKENGAFFSHMNVMFAYALYKRGFAREGFEVLDSLYNMSTNTALSKIYPGLPEYFNSEGRGMYHYLTGSASWFILTLVTQVFGVRGDMGSLAIEPKLVKEQFKNSNNISLETDFSGRKIKVAYINPKKLDFGKYMIGKIKINGKIITEIPIKKELFLKLTSKDLVNNIEVLLEKI